MVAGMTAKDWVIAIGVFSLFAAILMLAGAPAWAVIAFTGLLGFLTGKSI